MFQRNLKEFLQCHGTADETWIHYYTQETKNQSKMCTGPGETRFFPWFCFNNEKLISCACARKNRTSVYKRKLGCDENNLKLLGNLPSKNVNS